MLCDLSQTNKTKQNPKLPRILAQRQHIHTACDAKVYILKNREKLFDTFKAFL